MPYQVRIILLTAWAVWLGGFVSAKPTFKPPEKQDSRARWGMLLQAAAFLTLYWQRSPALEPDIRRLALAILSLTAAAFLSWSGVRALGRHFRMDAGLDADHQLVRVGPYRIVRHPIYASVLCMLIGSGLLLARWPALLLATALGVAGTEIRVRVEDALLASRFGEKFLDYQRSTPAYIPFLR